MPLALAALLSACTNLAPPYTPPAPAVPAEGMPALRDAAQLDLQEFFTDTRLHQLLALVLANNRDLRVAALNVDRARAQFRVQDTAALPNLGGSASASRSQAGNSQSVQLALSAYELDLFGRVRNLGESALEGSRATTETRRSVQISLVAEVANAWLTLAADLERQRLAAMTLESRQRSHQLNERKHQLGAITGLALVQSQTAVDSARVDVATAAVQLEQDRNALELLAGTAVPPGLLPTADESTATVSALMDLPAGVPSSVLQRRPDVLAAEHQLRAAHADIGVARAALFPRISLTATAGSSSRELSGLFKAGSSAWSFGPGISLPLFDGGANQANVDAARIAREIVLAQYDKAVQTAFREVADALAVRASLAERLAAQAALQQGSERQLRLAEALFRAGGSSQLEVLDAQRSLYGAQQALIALRLAEQTNRITLYKVLGGGWNNES